MEESFIEWLIDDTTSARSLQKAIGPSEIGGCRREVWHRLQRTTPTNQTWQWQAFQGTAIHAALQKRLVTRDVMGRYLAEVTVEFQGLRGHVDVYDTVNREVIDYKTTVKSKMKDFPTQKQWTQVHLYGYLLSNNGYDVDWVTLVCLPRDGHEGLKVVATQPYDEDVALKGLDWLASVQDAVVPPKPEISAFQCRSYCRFYDPSEETGCPGL